MTIGMDFVSKTVDINEETSISTIYLLSGLYRFANLGYSRISIIQLFIMIKEVFKSLVKSFYKGAAGIILVYSVVE